METEFPQLTGGACTLSLLWVILFFFFLIMSSSEVAQSYQTLQPPWPVPYQTSPSMGFSRQEYWSGLPFPSPGDLPDPGSDPGSPTLQADALPSEPPGESRFLEGF